MLNLNIHHCRHSEPNGTNTQRSAQFAAVASLDGMAAAAFAFAVTAVVIAAVLRLYASVHNDRAANRTGLALFRTCKRKSRRMRPLTLKSQSLRRVSLENFQRGFFRSKNMVSFVFLIDFHF